MADDLKCDAIIDLAVAVLAIQGAFSLETGIQEEALDNSVRGLIG